MNRGSANGAPAGGAFLVDIPEDWEPRAKQQPTGLIAYGTSCRRPVRVLHRPRKKSQVKRLGIFVVDGTGLEQHGHAAGGAIKAPVGLWFRGNGNLEGE